MFRHYDSIELILNLQDNKQLYNLFRMKTLTLLVLATLACLALTLPFKHQIALLNSLEVGRDEDPNVWACEGCEEDTKPTISHVIEEEEVKIRAILSVYEEYTVLAFRYTANAQNIWQDLLYAIQVQDDDAPSGCKVNKEYDRMWEAIRDDVISDLKQSVKTTRLILTGISLGGGLACLSYVDIKASGAFDNVEVISFGAPRVGNKKWASFFDSIVEHTRIFILDDPVAALPTCYTPLCNYQQTGIPYVCAATTETCTRKASGESLNLSQDSGYLVSELKEHSSELLKGDLNGVIDHIFGYKKIKDYTFVN